MTTEDKAKAYDEALKEAVIAHKDEDRHLKATLERIFPELAESEYERVRKEIVRFIQMEVEDEIVGNKWIAWLQKQKPVKCNEEDNKIRKRLLTNFSALGKEEWGGLKVRDICAWLERQFSPDMVADAYLKGCNDTEKKLLERQGEYYTEEDINNAYKCADGVQYKRGYEDALKELKQKIGV